MIDLIPKPGTVFYVTDYIKNNLFPCGTIGVLSYIAPKNSTMWRAIVVIIRRGKNGKRRIERATLSIPVFNSECIAIKDSYTSKNQSIHIRPVYSPWKDIVDYSDMEFLGWLNSYTWHLYNIANIAINSCWFQGDNRAIREMFNLNLNFTPKNENKIIENECNPLKRLSLISRVREAELSLLRCLYIYQYDIYRNLYANLSDERFYSCNREEKIIIGKAKAFANNRCKLICKQQQQLT